MQQRVSWAVAGAAAAALLAGGAVGFRLVGEWFGGCRATPLMVRHLTDRLAEDGVRPISIGYGCSGSWTHQEDVATVWLAGEDSTAGPTAEELRMLAERRLHEDGWRPRPPTALPGWVLAPHDDALLGSARPSWEAGFARAGFVLDLRVEAGPPAVVQLRVENTGRRGGVPDGVDGSAVPLPARALSDEEALRYGSAPALRQAVVPSGHSGWDEPRPLGLLTTYRTLLPPAAPGSALPRLVAGRAPAGLDPARTCGTGGWARFDDGRGCQLLGERDGVKVYVPYLVEDADGLRRTAPAEHPPALGDVVRYGPPMALIGTTSLILEGITLPPGAVVVQGQAAVASPAGTMLGLDDVLAVLASVRFDQTDP